MKIFGRNKGQSMRWWEAFTVIELVVAITIFFILAMASFAPYNNYINKAKLKTTVREISQGIYEAKNMAINWVVSSTWNVSIWFYVDASAWENNKIHIISYPYSFSGTSVTYSWPNIENIKTLTLQPGIQIDNIDGDKKNGLFFFRSITWASEYYYWESGVRKEILSPGEDTIDISISYKWATTRNLQKIITYYTKTNIIDY